VTRAPARLFALLAAAGLSRLLSGAPAAPDASLARDGKPPAAVRAEERDGRTFLLVNDAVAALDGTISWDERTRSYEVKVKGRTAVFGADTPIAVVDTRIVSLASPVRTSNLGAWAEPDFFVKVGRRPRRADEGRPEVFAIAFLRRRDDARPGRPPLSSRASHEPFPREAAGFAPRRAPSRAR
jgi:hypothetical protein